MRKMMGLAALALAIGLLCAPVARAADVDPFLGRWALTIPGGGAGWLEVTQEKGYLDGSILWGGGSVVPVSFVGLWDESTLVVQRTKDVERKNPDGKVVKKQTVTETLIGKVEGDTINLVQFVLNPNGQGGEQKELSGNRIPPIPPAPDMSKVKFGAPIKLFNGKDLSGWELKEAGGKNGWSVKDGVLINNPVQKEGQHERYANLRTVDTFEDFNISLDLNVKKGENSGVYLRGIYEVQVTDSYGKELDPHNMGAIYSRITPSMSAEKPAGEWQTLDITLVDRHVTVILNGKTIIDNAPLMGCTGGAMTSDEFKPGPIYLQGDHTGVMYRNIVLRPVVK